MNDTKKQKPIKKRLTCCICKRRMTVMSPTITKGYKCPLCRIQEDRENEAKRKQAQLNMRLENLWWLKD